ncbi:MAG: FHA domain-containing protein [Armatimonadetes bacterium]|nr:FHA domain-containing protein [Armatimonadota bacterium]
MTDDPNVTPAISYDPNRTRITPGPIAEVTQTIQPVQCPVCKTHNPAGEAFCVECGLTFASALPDDAFGAAVRRPPCLVDEAGREHYLREGANLVGRTGDVMLQDGRVSRKHAEITLKDGKILVKDLGSTNGTKVNGEDLGPDTVVELNPGDKLEFGGVALTLSTPGEGGVTQVPAGGKTQALETPPQVEAPAATLVGESEEFPLRVGENTVGRRPSNDVVIDDAYISGSHGKIEVTEEGVFFTDLGSTNGTLLNDAKLPANESVKIGPDDELKIGQQTFRIRIDAKEPEVDSEE